MRRFSQFLNEKQINEKIDKTATLIAKSNFPINEFIDWYLKEGILNEGFWGDVGKGAFTGAAGGTAVGGLGGTLLGGLGGAAAGAAVGGFNYLRSKYGKGKQDPATAFKQAKDQAIQALNQLKTIVGNMRPEELKKIGINPKNFEEVLNMLNKALAGKYQNIAGKQTNTSYDQELIDQIIQSPQFDNLVHSIIDPLKTAGIGTKKLTQPLADLISKNPAAKNDLGGVIALIQQKLFTTNNGYIQALQKNHTTIDPNTIVALANYYFIEGFIAGNPSPQDYALNQTDKYLKSLPQSTTPQKQPIGQGFATVSSNA